MHRTETWRLAFATLSCALAVGLAACTTSSPPPSSSSLDCLLGPDSDRPECANLDDDPEQCVMAGGIFDQETQRCIR